MPFPYLVTPAGKSREALCPRHNTDILQRVRGRHTHTNTQRLQRGRQADRERRGGGEKETGTKTNRDTGGRRLGSGAGRSQVCRALPQRWMRRQREMVNNEEVVAPSAARE